MQEFIFAARPKGMPDQATFRKQDAKLTPPTSGEVQLAPLYWSVDPYMRGRMNEGKSYVEAFEIGKPIQGGAVARVTESNDPKFKQGDLVTGMLPWATEAVASAKGLQKIESHTDHASLHLGILGMPGLTAYFGLLDIGQPKPGETVVVSGAAGAVGSTVGQIAKIKGCRVVGLAGTDEKVKLLKEKYGFDEVVNYKKAKDLAKAIASACPDGVDVYFDNVGGETADAVMTSMNIHGRVSICGQISLYNSKEVPVGPRPQMAILTKRLKAQGFIIFDYQARFAEGLKELTKWYDEGRLKTEETITKGFDKLPEALLGLFEGKNTGKMIVEA